MPSGKRLGSGCGEIGQNEGQKKKGQIWERAEGVCVLLEGEVTCNCPLLSREVALQQSSMFTYW